MINSALGMWGGSAGEDYICGIAQVFDGSFDYDTITGMPTTGLFTYAGERAFLIEVDLQNNNNVLFAYGYTTGASSGILIQYNVSDGITFQAKDGSGNRMVLTSTISVTRGKHTIIITKGASWRVADLEIYVDGVQKAKSSILDGITSQDVDASSAITLGRRSSSSSLYLQGSMRQFEILNIKPTALQIADASDPTTGGSFRAAGIAHDSGLYIAAVDFNKTNGQDPTTFAGTPAYTIAGSGGTEYTEFCP